MGPHLLRRQEARPEVRTASRERVGCFMTSDGILYLFPVHGTGADVSVTHAGTPQRVQGPRDTVHGHRRWLCCPCRPLRAPDGGGRERDGLPWGRGCLGDPLPALQGSRPPYNLLPISWQGPEPSGKDVEQQ